ncbi:MAG: FAD-dependent oxidoreductase, partial [Rhodospirillales bacterium]
MTSSIAIVGSGPSGFYAVDGLARALPGCRIDIIDRLKTPYGLVRHGVAPDHQGTKAVARQFERLALKPGVRFLGGIELGRDISLEELRRHYDAVVLATGATQDRKLGIAGEDLPGVFGSWHFVGWYNGHPDFAALDVKL